MKHRFGLHCFAQNTARGVYRWFLFSFLAFILAANVLVLQPNQDAWPDWQALSSLAIQYFLPDSLRLSLIRQLHHIHQTAYSLGFSL